MASYPPFNPPAFLRNPFVQSYLASTPFRAIGKNPMSEAAREIIIKTPDGTRLQGFYSKHPQSAGLVLLIHGWEGSAGSTYVRCSGRYFYTRGYSVFRLNLRDHGESHHLNLGLFFGSLLQEVVDAVDTIAAMEADRPFFMVGFSMGGNYVLRVAARAGHRPIHNLAHAAAVSPVIDPARATRLIDARPAFRFYFLRKWRRSLAKKQNAFPGKYDFSEICRMNSIYQMTEELLMRYSSFDSPDAYFSSYALTDDALATVRVPTTLITAKDDPIIPADDFEKLNVNDRVRFAMQDYGGHNGFIESLSLRVWYQPYILRLFTCQPRQYLISAPILTGRFKFQKEN